MSIGWEQGKDRTGGYILLNTSQTKICNKFIAFYFRVSYYISLAKIYIVFIYEIDI